jgi:hypothetical protein
MAFDAIDPRSWAPWALRVACGLRISATAVGVDQARRISRAKPHRRASHEDHLKRSRSRFPPLSPSPSS